MFIETCTQTFIHIHTLCLLSSLRKLKKLFRHVHILDIGVLRVIFVSSMKQLSASKLLPRVWVKKYWRFCLFIFFLFPLPFLIFFSLFIAWACPFVGGLLCTCYGLRLLCISMQKFFFAFIFQNV